MLGSIIRAVWEQDKPFTLLVTLALSQDVLTTLWNFDTRLSIWGSRNKIIIERVDFRTRHSTHKQEAASVISKFTEIHLSTEPKGE